MRYLLLIMPLLLWGVGPYHEQCKHCHSSIFKLSDIYTKKEWYQVTKKDNDTLKHIHKNENGVLKYFNSSSYSPKKLYRDMEFYAPETEGVKNLAKTCYICHEGHTKTAKLWSDEQWMELYNSVEPLAETHKNYPETSAYIRTETFKSSLHELIKKMQIFANSDAYIKKSKIEKSNREYCLSCHDSRVSLSKLWTKKEWMALHSSMESLKEVHNAYPDVIKFINSENFLTYKKSFIEDMKLFAPESLLKSMTLSKGNYTLTYEVNGVTKERIQESLDYFVGVFKECKIDSRMKLHLTSLDVDGTLGNTVTFFTMGIIPSVTTTTWQLNAVYNQQHFKVVDKTKRGFGWFSEEGEAKKSLFERMAEKLKHEMDVECEAETRKE